MAVVLPEGRSYPLDFSPCCPLNDAEGQHSGSLSWVTCPFFSVSRILLISGNVHPNLGPVPAQCAVEMWPGGVGLYNAAPALNVSIQGAHFSLVSLMFWVAHSWSCSHCCVSASPRGPQSSSTVSFSAPPPARISPLFSLTHLAPFTNAAPTP